MFLIHFMPIGPFKCWVFKHCGAIAACLTAVTWTDINEALSFGILAKLTVTNLTGPLKWDGLSNHLQSCASIQIYFSQDTWDKFSGFRKQKTGRWYKNYWHLHAKKCALGPAVASGGSIKQIRYMYDVHRDTEHTAEPLRNTHTLLACDSLYSCVITALEDEAVTASSPLRVAPDICVLASHLDALSGWMPPHRF